MQLGQFQNHKRSGLPISDDSEVFEIFAELLREQQRLEGGPIPESETFNHEDIIFDDDLARGKGNGS